MVAARADGAQPATARWKIHLAVAVMCVVWGSTWVVIAKGLDEMPPLGSAGVRFALAWLILSAICPWLARAEGGDRPRADLVAAMAIGNFAISFGIVYWAELVLPSSLTAILWAVFPIVTALVTHVSMPGSRIVGVQWIALVVGFVGVVLLMVTDIEALGGDAVFHGCVLLLSPVASAIATDYVKRHGAGTSSVLLNRASMFWGAAILCGLAFVFEGSLPVPQSRTAAFSIVYLAAVGTVLSFSLYFWVLRQASTVSLSLITYVTPALALAAGWVFEEERPTRWTFAGLALILIGCAGVLRGGGRRSNI